jgi:hypothetical protein
MRNGDGFADFRGTALTKLMNRETVGQGEFVGNPEAIQSPVAVPEKCSVPGRSRPVPKRKQAFIQVRLHRLVGRRLPWPMEDNPTYRPLNCVAGFAAVGKH